MSVIDISVQILEKYCLCDNCLGRQFALLVRGLSNAVRGFSIKLAIAMNAHKMIRDELNDRGVAMLRVLAENGRFELASRILEKLGFSPPPPKTCYICGGVFEKLDEIANEVVQLLSNYEFSTFLVGSRIPGEIAEREDLLRSEFNLNLGESFKSEFNRELGKLVQKITGKNVDFTSPDIVVIVDLNSGSIEVKPSPLFIYGKYRKLVRGMPQCTWICSSCGGRGCENCNYTGKKYPTSVEELVAGPVLEFTGGSLVVFHGAGREDVDARMLGSGRPFVVEVKEPKRRFVDLRALEEEINRRAEGKIEVFDLRFSSRLEVKRMKALSPMTVKIYRALVEVEGEVGEEELRKLEEFFSNREIRQRTPLRVLHRRVDKVRVKRVYELKAKLINPRLLELTIKCQGGLYVKELISGDEGRTRPSVSEVLGHPAKCVELDVIYVSEVV